MQTIEEYLREGLTKKLMATRDAGDLLDSMSLGSVQQKGLDYLDFQANLSVYRGIIEARVLF